MRRWVALAFLLLVAFYVGTAAFDRCADNPRDNAPVCHILCNDDCATAPIPEAPAAMPPDPLPGATYAAPRPQRMPSRRLEPEKTPPRTGRA